MSENTLGQKRSGGRAARHAARKSTKSSAVHPGLEGGFYRPLSEADIKQVHGAVLEVLATIGMADASPELICPRDRTRRDADGEWPAVFSAIAGGRHAGERAAGVFHVQPRRRERRAGWRKTRLFRHQRGGDLDLRSARPSASGPRPCSISTISRGSATPSTTSTSSASPAWRPISRIRWSAISRLPMRLPPARARPAACRSPGPKT